MENNNMPVGVLAGNAKIGMIALSVGLLVIGLLTGYFIGKGGGQNRMVYQSTTPIASINSSAMPSDWKTYRNYEYGFEIQYLGMLISDDNYIRMQNYSPATDELLLNPGEYYLEMGLSDPACTKSLSDILITKNGDTTFYRGYDEEGGDAGGIRFGLCANMGNRWIMATVTEANKDGLLGNQILSTFKFTK